MDVKTWMELYSALMMELAKREINPRDCKFGVFRNAQGAWAINVSHASGDFMVGGK